VIGIDDWAWRKGHRYGALTCDLERREIIDLPPDREPATVAARLASRPSVEIIARDRGGGCGAGAAIGRPEAVQVADRRRLFENASAAFPSALKREMRDVRRALGHGPVDPATLIAAERLQHEGWRRRADAEAAVIALHKQGVAIKEIVRRTGRSRKRVARHRSRRPRRAVPSEGRLHRALARQAECRVERRLPQRGRPLAPPPHRGLPGEPAGGDGMGDAAAAR
jgi:transposase